MPTVNPKTSPVNNSVEPFNGEHAASPQLTLKRLKQDHLSLRFSGKLDNPTQVREAALAGEDLSTAKPQAIYQALVSLPHAQLTAFYSSTDNYEQLQLAARKLAYQLGCRGELNLLQNCLRNEAFQQSPLRALVINNLLRFDTPERNYQLSQEIKFPSLQTDQQAMTGKIYERSLESYKTNLRIVPQELRGKRILLIGGGLSPICQELEQEGVDAEVVNVDKFFPLKNKHCEHIKIPGDFNSSSIDQELFFEKYDEVWASYSLPAYLKKVEDVPIFLKRALRTLKTNGILRIIPTTRQFLGPPEGIICEEYPGKDLIGLNDNQLLSRPLIYKRFESLLSNLDKHPDLFQKEEFYQLEQHPKLPYSLYQTGVIIKLIGDPKIVERITR